MTDNIDENVENVEINDDKDVVIADLHRQIEAISNKSKELLAEKKQQQQKARDAEAAREVARMEKAKKEGDYEQLLKSSEKQRSELESKLNELTSNITKEKLSTQALKISADLADGANAKILARFVQERITYVDGEIKVLDKEGRLTVSPIEQLVQEFKNSDDFKSLLRGSKASGGNAVGGTNGTPGNKVINRATFDKMSQADRMSFHKTGGRVVEDSNT